MNASESRLREALRARADEVEAAPDALVRIRARTAARSRRAWTMLGAAVAAAGVVAAGVVVLADRPHAPAPVPGVSVVPSPAAPSASAAPSAAPATTTVTLPVYFARNGRLYREFRPLTVAGDSDRGRVAAAVAASLAGNAADPDYRTLWPAGAAVRGVSFDGARVTVDLTGAGPAPTDLAVQQLVYTVAAATTYTSVRQSDGVRLLVDGAPLGGVRRPAPIADVQAPVWVIEPAQGAAVGRTFTVHLAGVVFEGTVNLRVRGPGGALVAEQVVQLSAGAPALGEAHVPLTLAPGRYTIEAFFVSQKDSSVQWVDDHDFTVG